MPTRSTITRSSSRRTGSSGGGTVAGVSKIVAGAGISVSPAAGTGIVTVSATATSKWSSLGNPTANLSLSMGAFTSLFTYNAATGAGNLFRLVDTAANTGTGYIFSTETAATSQAKPFRVVARGITAIDTSVTGAVTLGTTGSLAGSLAFAGLTSGSLTLTAAAVSGSQSYTLPASAPSAANTDLLSSTQAGVMSWVTQASLAPTLNNVANPTANKTFSMGTNKLTFSYNGVTGSALTIVETASTSGYLLDVNAASDSKPFRFATSIGSACLSSFVDSAGYLYVGVGVITPAAALDVAGIQSLAGALPKILQVTGVAGTGTLTASTEATEVLFDLSHSVSFATGALTTQRSLVVSAPTLTFAGASTVTNAATVAITGAPIAGANATITNSHALWIQGGGIRSGTAGTAAGVLRLDGLTSGSITFTAAAASGTQTYTLPTGFPAGNGYALTSTTLGVMSWTNVATTSLAWSALTDPTGNLALSMGNTTTAMTWSTATGAGVNMLTLADGTSNTGTGAILAITLANSSAATPFLISTDTPTTNAAINLRTFTVTSSNTVAANFGGQELYRLESAGGTTRDAAAIRLVWSTATNAAEVASFRIGLMNAGAAIPAAGAEQYRFGAAGNAMSTGLGSVTAPTWGMGNEATGWYMTGSAQAALAANGVKLVEVYSGYFIHQGRSYCGVDGTNSDNAFTWSSDADTGLNRVTGNSFVLVAGASTAVGISLVSSAVRIGLYGTANTIQYATTNTTTGFTANASANTVFAESTFTGNTGSTAYTVGDIVRALKLIGLMAA